MRRIGRAIGAAKEDVEREKEISDAVDELGLRKAFDAATHTSHGHSCRYVYETDDRSRSLMPLASFCADTSLEAGACLAQVQNMRVWLSGLDPFLIDSVLSAAFEEDMAGIADNWWFCTTRDDGAELTSVFHLAMIFGWDLRCYMRGPVFNLEIDHQGALHFCCHESTHILEQRFLDRTGRRMMQV